MTPADTRLLAVAVASIDALRRVANVTDQDVANVLLNVADLLEGASGGQGSELTRCDALLADHVQRQVNTLASSLGPMPTTSGSLGPVFFAEMAIAALKDSARDVSYVAKLALDEAARRALKDGWDEAMDLPRKISSAHDAIALRVAMIEPEVGRFVVAGRGGDDAIH